MIYVFLDDLLLRLIFSSLQTNKTLIVRVDAIGDFVLWIEAGKVLIDDCYSKKQNVVLLANQAWANWAKEMNLAKEIWALDIQRFERDFLYRWHWLKKIRKAGFSTVIHPTYSRSFLGSDSLVRATHAPTRIGSQGDLSNIQSRLKIISDRWYTKLLPASQAELMELRRNAEFMRGMGFSSFKAKVAYIRQSKLVNLPLELRGSRYVVFFPGASWVGRLWPVENFFAIGLKFAELGLKIVIAGGPSDHEQAMLLTQKLSYAAINLVGKTSLSMLAEILRNAELVVTNETSAVHIGAAVQTPTICILGGGHYGRFVPYVIDEGEDSSSLPKVVTFPMPCFGCNWQCKYPRDSGNAVKCIENITVDHVWMKIEEVFIKPSSLHF